MARAPSPIRGPRVLPFPLSDLYQLNQSEDLSYIYRERVSNFDVGIRPYLLPCLLIVAARVWMMIISK
jgi:hypothetical protein